jgi:hypothetical protein
MLKRVAIILTAVFAIASCTESDPPIIFDNASEILKDTVYQLAEADIPAANSRNILIEDVTGVRCPNCPKAAGSAEHIKDTFGSRVVVLGLYSTDPSNLTFPFSGDEDLRTTDAQLIGTNIFEFSNQLPAGGVNRKLFTGQSNINYDFKLWLNGAIQLYHTNSIVNMSLNRTQINDSTYQIAGKFTFTDQPDFNPFVSIALTEDNLNSTQRQPNGADDPTYIHEHVLRKMYTPYNGTPLVKPTDIQPNRGVVVEKVWEITIPENVDINEASIAVFLNYNDANSKEVLQCLEIKLK